MANGWVKSLQCKSKAFEDVHHPNPNPNPNPNPKTLAPSYSCRKNAQSLKEVFEPRKPKSKPKPRAENRKPEPVSSNPSLRSRRGVLGDSFRPALTELPDGHASRKVVEIIFHTSWGPKAFPGRVEMMFKVQNGARTVFRFEEYREVVKTRSGWRTREENARCVADGNEMMRFYCLGPAGATNTDSNSGGGAWGILAGKGNGGGMGSVRTFSGSSAAHESSGGGRGRRAMLVCRVIAGRVGKRGEFGFDSVDVDGRVKIDSVSGDEGELLVFDPRAVLPCFLIIYRL